MQITPDVTNFEWGNLETLPSGNGQYVEKGTPTGVVGAENNELRITVPLKEIAAVTTSRRARSCRR